VHHNLALRRQGLYVEELAQVCLLYELDLVGSDRVEPPSDDNPARGEYEGRVDDEQLRQRVGVGGLQDGYKLLGRFVVHAGHAEAAQVEADNELLLFRLGQLAQTLQDPYSQKLDLDDVPVARVVAMGPAIRCGSALKIAKAEYRLPSVDFFLEFGQGLGICNVVHVLLDAPGSILDKCLVRCVLLQLLTAKESQYRRIIEVRHEIRIVFLYTALQSLHARQFAVVGRHEAHRKGRGLAAGVGASLNDHNDPWIHCNLTMQFRNPQLISTTYEDEAHPERMHNSSCTVRGSTVIP
jgi:hypothetical protein